MCLDGFILAPCTFAFYCIDIGVYYYQSDQPSQFA